MSALQRERVAVVGSGIVGAVWAAMFAKGGYSVTMYDIKNEQLVLGKENARKTLDDMERLGMTSVPASELYQEIAVTTDLGIALQDCVYIQECVPEIEDLKKKVFTDIDDALSASGNATCVIASSSSCMMPSTFTGHIQAKERCLVAHPVNPPHYIPVVEVVKSKWTSAATVEKCKRILVSVGQVPVVLNKEIDGFLVNRLQYALLREAFQLVANGVASPADVDACISQGLGLRWSFMGPFQTIDLNAPGGVKDYFGRYGETINRILGDMGQTGMHGQDTIDRIHADMRQEVAEEKLGERAAWRNRRLGALAVHKMEQNDTATSDGTER